MDGKCLEVRLPCIPRKAEPRIKQCVVIAIVLIILLGVSCKAQYRAPACVAAAVCGGHRSAFGGGNSGVCVGRTNARMAMAMRNGRM